MRDMKCPFCQQELREIYCYNVVMGYLCPNPDCKETEHFKGNKELWQALIDTKEERDKFEQHYKCLSHVFKHQIEVNDFLGDEAIKLQKKLDIAVDALKMIGSGDIIEHSVVGHEDDNKIFIANKALEQITALEQKDVK